MVTGGVVGTVAAVVEGGLSCRGGRVKEAGTCGSGGSSGLIRSGLVGREGKSLGVEFVAHEAFHLLHEGFEVAALAAAHGREAGEEDVEVVFAFEEDAGVVAGGAFEDVGEAAGYVGEFLLLR